MTETCAEKELLDCQRAADCKAKDFLLFRLRVKSLVASEFGSYSSTVQAVFCLKVESSRCSCVAVPRTTKVLIQIADLKKIWDHSAVDL